MQKGKRKQSEIVSDEVQALDLLDKDFIYLFIFNFMVNFHV